MLKGDLRRRALLLGCLLAVVAAAPAHAARPSALQRTGRWLTDQQGRVFVGHGFNIVKKVAPFVRTGFTEADAQLLQDEGFNLARIGFIWEGVEPTPGVYDDAYIRRVLALDSLLARHGIRTLVDFHQDAWARGNGGDGAPAWATLGSSADASFAAFWRDAKGPGGVGIQTRFARAWNHVAGMLRHRRNILGLDPFNEPYPGSDYGAPCGDFSRCHPFESGALAAFYRRVTTAIRHAGDHHVIYPEGVADSGASPPSLPAFGDRQTAFTFHYYCALTQLNPRQALVGDLAPEAVACAPIEYQNITRFLSYANRMNVPTLLGEFSCSDVNPDNAQIVDQVGAAFASWTIWAYYTAADDPADCPAQGVLVSDSRPAVAKHAKLDALAVPFARAIAGTPLSTTFDRAGHVFTLDYDTAAVRGARLRRGALTEIFVPVRQYPRGYDARATGARVVSPPGARVLRLRTDRGAHIAGVRITRR